uniref:Uncharacterized protein n=1 Tax=viral metagenome TaxID=1070528 RepID=A0A6H1ZC69_9ZZZZ
MDKDNKVIAISLVVVLLMGAALVRFGAFAGSLTSPTVVIENVETLNLSGIDAGADGVLGGLVHNIQETFDAGIAVGGTEVISSSRGLSASTANVTGNLSQGEANTTGYVYFGTTDGCGAMTFSASGTTPTLTPTSTSFCN